MMNSYYPASLLDAVVGLIKPAPVKESNAAIIEFSPIKNWLHNPSIHTLAELNR